MKYVCFLGVGVGVVSSIGAAPPGAELPFSFTSPGGAIPRTGSNETGISVFSLIMDPAHSDLHPAPPFPMPSISSLELVLTGLTHSYAGDLDIYLIDPFGKTLEIMTDRGNSFGIDANLVFNDFAGSLPPQNGQIESGAYLPEDSNITGGFSKYIGGSGGTDAWILLVIDDAPGDGGELQSFTLRSYIPEPMALSLLMMGVSAVLCRRRFATRLRGVHT